MGEFAKLVLAWLGNPVRGLAAFMIASAVTLLLWRFAPFGDAMKDPFWRWPTLILILSASGLATYPVEHVWGKLSRRRNHETFSKHIVSRLHDLTIHEKKALHQFIVYEQRGVAFGREGGAVDVLARDGVLSLSDKTPDPLYSQIPMDLYFINETAWKYLRQHPELIELEPNRPVTPLQR